VKPENIKASFGATKPALGLLPTVFKLATSMALMYGARKYGRFNWRGSETAPIRISVYVSAMQRHLDAYASGEEVASDSGVHHLGHLAASCAILLDAMAKGRVNDDRAVVDIDAEMTKAIALMATWPEAKFEVHG
jgi:hypothetical protein